MFTPIAIYFLVVELTPPTLRRHTHGQVDQAFSCHSRWLRKHKAVTIDQLSDELYKSYTAEVERKPLLHRLEESVDVQAWLDAVSFGVSNITGSQQYLIEAKMIDGVRKAVLSCKQFAASSNDRWVEVGPLLKVRLALEGDGSHRPPFVRPLELNLAVR
jgi:hypothetical protein